MKLYGNCGQPIQEDIGKNPAEILGNLLEECISEDDVYCLCPACKQELGMKSLMGFW